MTQSDRDIVVSTRVRLARSLDGLLFPTKMSHDQEIELNQRIEKRINGNGDFQSYRMSELDGVERQVLVERHVASAELVNKPNAMLLLSRDEKISLLVGEEDHLRIQSVLPGLSLDKADELTRSIDNILSAEGYAYDEQYGYLTACPTNVGTGMRASVMLHVPALKSTGQLRSLAENINKFGYTIRGYYGEGSSVEGDMFQLSNQVTLGVSEDEILDGLTQLLRSIITKERQLRDALLKNDSGALSDRLHRSLGILKYARRIRSNEMMERLSDIRLGLSLNLFDGVRYEDIEQLEQKMQPASILSVVGHNATSEQRDEARAAAVRLALKDCHF